MSLAGQALGQFELAVYDWLDEGQAIVDDSETAVELDVAQLTYKYYYKIGDVITNFDTIKPVLPAGDPSNHDLVIVTVEIIDLYGSRTTCEVQSTVIKC